MFKKLILLLCFLITSTLTANAKVVFQTDTFSSDGTTLTPLYGLVLDPSSISIKVGSTIITGGTNGQCLYDNSGIIGTQSCGSGSGLTIGTSTITGGTPGYLLYNNSGVLGNLNPAGLTLAWSQITSTPTTLSGYGITSPLPINQGGTNATIANAGLNNLLPSQTSNTGLFLQTNGTNTTWAGITAAPTRPAFFESDSVVYPSGDNQTYAILANTDGYNYVLFNTMPCTILKVSQANGTITSTLTLNSGEDGAASATIDPSTNILYVGTLTAAGLLVKVDLGSFTRVGAINITTDAGTNNVGSVVIAGAFLYADAVEEPGTIDIMSKINLSSFTNVAHINSPTNTRGLYGHAYDGTRYIYYGSDYNAPGTINKLDTNTFTFNTPLVIGTGSNDFRITGLALDNTGTFLYGASISSPTIIYQVATSSFTVVNSISGPTGANTNVINPIFFNGKLYVGCYTSPGEIIRLDTTTFVIDRVLTLTYNSVLSMSNVLNGILYVGMDDSPGTSESVTLLQ